MNAKVAGANNDTPRQSRSHQYRTLIPVGGIHHLDSLSNTRISPSVGLNEDIRNVATVAFTLSVVRRLLHRLAFAAALLLDHPS